MNNLPYLDYATAVHNVTAPIGPRPTTDDTQPVACPQCRRAAEREASHEQKKLDQWNAWAKAQ